MDLSHLTQWSAEYVTSRLEYFKKSAYLWDCNMLSDGYHFTHKRESLHVKCIETVLLIITLCIKTVLYTTAFCVDIILSAAAFCTCIALPSLRDGSMYL